MPGASIHKDRSAEHWPSQPEIPLAGTSEDGLLSPSRSQDIRLELYRTIMRAYRTLPVFFPTVAMALAFTFNTTYPEMLVAAWWFVLLAVHVEYAFFQRRFFAEDSAAIDVDAWIKATAIRYWIMNVVWLGLLPLFWHPGSDVQNLAILMVFVVHVVMASQTAFHLVPIFVSVTLPLIAVVIAVSICTLEAAYMAIGFGCIPTYLYLARIAQQQRAAAYETFNLRFRNADLIRDIGKARDLSEEARLRAEEANAQLQRREHHFRALVENAFDVVLVTDEQAIIRYASPAAEKIGLSIDALIGMNSLDFLTKEQKEELLKDVAPGNGASRVLTYELLVPRQDDRSIWIEATLTNLLHDENVRGYVVNLRDITERKRAETEQRSQFGVLRALATGVELGEVMSRLALGSEEAHPGARAAVFLLDAKEDLITCAAPHLPADFPEWVGGFWQSQKDHDFGRMALAGHKIVATDLQEEHHGESISSYMRGAGISTVWFKPILSRSGKVIGAFAMYFAEARTPGKWEEDYVMGAAHLASIAIERRRAEEGLRQATETAEMANRAKTKFLANMSHELRTPLNAIIGFSEIMSQEMFGPLGSDRYREYTNDIHGSGRHLLNVIDDILDISKIEAGRYVLEEDEIDMAHVLKWSVEMMRARTLEKRQNVNLHLPEAIPNVRADQRAMRQIMLNLLSNASKFTPAEGRIDLNVSRNDAGDLMVSVADSGIGIPRNKLDEVLEPFGQVDDTSARQHGGTGLGLPITKSLIEMHGGSFTLESTLGAGTTATMIFPAHRLLSLEGKSKTAAH
ncbi:multi-sensor signal transduction histidine kinase [Parvibaculum lavamentivorans DS-1]|uniref:histidine kinase n=1 Tax=Parvibaculum lavamentivorans (strain DS-1 / DSM 13023 / NCIMB 13966) TaxID=402881 RepID=A7HTT6_PARL1|nr:ATP-binding protein [Parvibaculum lavamentivorans]ABS63319.1 multi-sensor signal transduction histidine kinase [Parvibaculum lavamentivorans DS-1]